MERVQFRTASLDRLSDELIIEIARQLEVICHGNKSLAPLVLCSRRLNNILSPLLYQIFDQAWNGFAGLAILLRVVMEKPGVGTEVRKLVLSEQGEADDYKGCFDNPVLSPEDFERCRTAIESFELSIDKQGWLEGIARGSWDAVVALLLFFLPSLEELEIESGGLVDSTYLNQVVHYMAFNQSTGRAVHSLRHLKTFSNAYWDTEMGTEIRSILPYCAIPSVTTIRATMVSQEDYEQDPFLAPSDRYGVQNLRFDNTCIGGNLMKELLTCFPYLQKFYYAHGGATVGFAGFLPQKFGESLAHLHESLEELTLWEYDGYYGDELRLPLGSLARFKKLRYFGTNAEVLFGRDNLVKPHLSSILPASLESLVILGCNDDIYRQLQGLISYERQKAFRLKTITIDVPNERARTGDWQGIGPDGFHARAEELKETIEFLNAHPHTLNWKEDIHLAEWRLERIQSRKPRGVELEAWRTSKGVEKELTAEYEKAGISLRFGAQDDETAASLPPFMSY